MEIKNFDATGIPPQQMGDKHPEGNFPFQISNTYGQQNKNSPGGQFVVELTSPVGMIVNRYNLWNQSQQAVEIAHKELSALCHAVGVFKLSFENVPPTEYGKELRGARGSMKVGPQANNPEYMEVKKIYDAAGNEPGKAPTGAPQTQGNSGGGWGQTAQNPPPNNQGGGWTAGPSTQQQQPQGQATQSPTNPNKPPWAS